MLGLRVRAWSPSPIFQCDGFSSPVPQTTHRVSDGSCTWRFTPESLSLSSAVGLQSLNIESRRAFGFHSDATAAKVIAGISALLLELAFRPQGHTVCAFILAHNNKLSRCGYICLQNPSRNRPTIHALRGCVDLPKTCANHGLDFCGFA